MITKYLQGEWIPIKKIYHIPHTNLIIVRYKPDDGVAVAVVDMVRQEHVCWLVRYNSTEELPGGIVDTYMSKNGKEYFILTAN